MFFFRRKRSAAPEAKLQAILFDVFGTTVDWRGSMTEHARRLGAERGIDADWNGLVVAWRARYKPAIKPVREGKRKWTGFDELLREELDKIVRKFGAAKLTGADRDRLTQGWHHLTPWPDVSLALAQLKQHFIVGPLSNGTTRQMVDLAKGAGLPWDVVFGADLFRTYKPAKQMYLGASAWLGLKPDEVLMVAAHNEDLEHARRNGMRTCFVKRATEDSGATGKYDFIVEDFEELAQSLGAV